ncbi:hypothetical protein KL86DPRO_11166 [uncultured delta proteobacterium]|uniref:Uncharacterized protein n=1 Tax=uncultured delta proteobacterium TaxID=34034 RepID=A0A212JCG7_9DELT|nr:hypothetical protein KL86DPRO_11166 [uncultured delta proteobacterium]
MSPGRIHSYTILREKRNGGRGKIMRGKQDASRGMTVEPPFSKAGRQKAAPPGGAGSVQTDDKPRKAVVCEGTPTPALNGGNECRLRLRGGLLSKRTLSTTSAPPGGAGSAG